MKQIGSDHPAQTIPDTISLRTPPRAAFSASSPILVAACIAALFVLHGCAPAPKYRAHSETRALQARQTGPSGGETAPLGIGLRPPVKGFRLERITSPFGFRPSDGRRHDGIDIKARQGEEILATASGTVVFSGKRQGYGNVVILDHGDGISSLYAHLFYASVRKGESVGAGEAVGRAGRRGRATGTHLHFEVRRNGSPIDPVPHLYLDSGRDETS